MKGDFQGKRVLVTGSARGIGLAAARLFRQRGATVLLHGLGAATSGTGGRRWGPKLHHLIDPRTGLPADSDLAEVSVLAPTAAEAEVLAKTALLLGRDAGARLLDERSLGSYLR